MSHEACGVAETARVVGWLAGESAGQCGPCVHGVAALASPAAPVPWVLAPREP